jgi:hypothetical protein
VSRVLVECVVGCEFKFKNLKRLYMGVNNVTTSTCDLVYQTIMINYYITAHQLTDLSILSTCACDFPLSWANWFIRTNYLVYEFFIEFFNYTYELGVIYIRRLAGLNNGCAVGNRLNQQTGNIP